MMAKGNARCQYLGQTGMVSDGKKGIYDFIYKIPSGSRDTIFNIGDRVVTPEGKVFRYYKSGGACWTGRGAAFYNTIKNSLNGIDYSLITTAQTIGDRQVTMTNGSTVQAVDSLRGGHIVLKIATGSNDAELQQRGIVGNTAAGALAACTIYLDAPLTSALTGASYAFCMPSPYNNIINAETIGNSAGAYSIAGIPAVYVSTSSYYSWIQTWGQIWIAPQGDVGASDNKRQVVFRWDGSVGPHDDSDANEEYQQHAGFVMDNNLSGNGATVIMLQVSV